MLYFFIIWYWYFYTCTLLNKFNSIDNTHGCIHDHRYNTSRAKCVWGEMWRHIIEIRLVERTIWICLLSTRRIRSQLVDYINYFVSRLTKITHRQACRPSIYLNYWPCSDIIRDKFTLCGREFTVMKRIQENAELLRLLDSACTLFIGLSATLTLDHL